jgi:hypothetical protein
LQFDMTRYAMIREWKDREWKVEEEARARSEG